MKRAEQSASAAGKASF
ncbi:hypothetical protein SPND219_02324 [Streptococcus pneumoniae]|nr:hypothetical protein SPND219_02324 [Streptococcus pneumoniae]